MGKSVSTMRNRGKRLHAGVALFLAAAFLPAGIAGADAEGRFYTQQTVQGCLFHEYRSAPPDEGWWEYRWSGSCTPGQPISGTGVLTQRSDHEDWGALRFEWRDSGMLVNGVWEGEVRSESLESENGGPWQEALRCGNGDQQCTPTFATYTKGCSISYKFLAGNAYTEITKQPDCPAPPAAGPAVSAPASDPLSELKARALAGDAVAQGRLAVRYYNGDGVAQDRGEAARWLLAAAEQGRPDVQKSLGNLYYHGDGVAQDYRKSARWYLAAAEQGEAAAQNSLGHQYYEGLGVTQDRREAARWFLAAAEQGHPVAQESMGNLYYRGIGVAQDRLEAERWYLAASEQGRVGAQVSLGSMYHAAQDYREASRWFLAAAEQGHSAAQRELAALYYYGQGIAPDLQKAAYWWQQAAAQGDQTASRNLAELQRPSTPAAAPAGSQSQKPQASAAESEAMGRLLMGGLTAALGGDANQVAQAMTGQPVTAAPAPRSSQSSSSSSSKSCTGQSKTVSCLMEQCRETGLREQERNPGYKFECRASTNSNGADCVSYRGPRISDSSTTCTDGFGAAR